MKRQADENNHHCPECQKVFNRLDALEEHISHKHVQTGAGKRPVKDENDLILRK